MIYREDYDNAQDYLDALIRRRRLKIRLLIACIVLVIAGIIGFLLTYYKVRNTQVTGNTRYTNEEISDMVTGGFLSDNSLILSIKYRNKQITNVPFIEQMDVTVVTHDTIKITVYEKSLAGYVTYLGSNFYFGRDGKVVESSREALDGVPQILGLTFDYIALYEQLPVADPAIFSRILNVTQLLSKYDLAADSIYFDASGDMTIYFGDVRVAMGGDNYTDEKLSNVAKILPSLDGRGAGTLKMSSYTPSTRFITYVVKDGKATNLTSSGTAAGPEETQPDAATTGTADTAGTTDTTGTDSSAGDAGTTSADTAVGTTTGTIGWESIPETAGTTEPAGTTGTADTTTEPAEPTTATETTDADADTAAANEGIADPVIPDEAVEVTE